MRKAILLTAIFLAACSNYSTNLPSIKPYKMDIQQGNVVTPKMMMQLRPGMSKTQVRFVMGTPLITDSFHANRWDYFYQMRKAGKVIEQRRVILEFEDDKLKRVRGDVIPAGSGAEEPLPGDRPAASKAPITLKPANGAASKKQEKGMLDKLKFWKSDEEEKAPAPAPAAEEAKPAIKPEAPAAEEKPEVLPPLMETPAAEAPAPAAQPAPKAEPRQETKPAPKPEPSPEPKPAPAQKQEEKGLLDKLKFWKSDDSKAPAAPEAKPAPRSEPAPAPRQPEARPEPKPEVTAAPKVEPKPAAKAEPKPVPQPQDNLPAEEDPSYFERMLEKIGF